MDDAPRTWHHGLVATWWAEFNREGPEIDYFRRFIERGGEPALDVGCGTGRLLIPYLRAGLDVDGCDVSADMIALCRERAEAEGLSPRLAVQPMSELDMPRRYRTIVVCGAFGLGSTREQDARALERLYAHLEPGGRLLLDNEPPYVNARQWRYWPKEERARLPEAESASEPRRTSDGSDLGLDARIVSLDPLAQRLTYAMRARMWRAGELVAEEHHTLDMSMYLTQELLLMVERAGFAVVALHGDYAEEPATADTDFVIVVARRP